ncbi:MAG: RNB domain-containing ribonuclease [Thermodesulfobacteriota bacterium]
MEAGRVVEFIEGRTFLTALVTRVKGGKLNVLSETDREMSLASGRVLHQTTPGLNPARPRAETVRHLKDISLRRQELSRQVDLAELWELLEGEGQEFDYVFLAGLVWPGEVTPDRAAAVLRAVFEDGLYFKMRPEGATRHEADKVEQIAAHRAREAEREKTLVEGGAWLEGVWQGEPGEAPACRDRVVRTLRDMAVHGAEAPEYKWGHQLLERAGIGPDPLNPFYLLVKLGEMDQHENLDLQRNGLPTDFPEEVRAVAERVARDRAWLDQDRRDLTGLRVMTADSGGARDFDDAVSLEVRDDRLVLGVHIADVSALIRPGDLLDRAAFERATSIYMPDRRITMLPEVLSEESLSLQEGEVRPAFSMLAELTEAGEVLSYRFFRSLVKVSRQLSYQEVDGAVEHDLELSRMHRLSLALKARRTAQDALILPLPKLNVYLTPEGEIGVNLTLWENPGRSMISEFMILCNHLAARWLLEQEAPCLFRSQEEPSEKLIQSEADCANLYLCLKQRKFLSRVNWDLDPQPHSGMGLDVYTNLTSPLRRYIDLMIQRQVASLVEGGPPVYPAETLGEALVQVEETLRKAAKVQNNRRRYWLLRYLDGAGRKEYEALVLERLPHRWRIFLPELMLDADLPVQTGQDLTPGETVRVKIKKASAREDALKLSLS